MHTKCGLNILFDFQIDFFSCVVDFTYNSTVSTFFHSFCCGKKSLHTAIARNTKHVMQALIEWSQPNQVFRWSTNQICKSNVTLVNEWWPLHTEEEKKMQNVIHWALVMLFSLSHLLDFWLWWLVHNEIKNERVSFDSYVSLIAYKRSWLTYAAFSFLSLSLAVSLYFVDLIILLVCVRNSCLPEYLFTLTINQRINENKSHSSRCFICIFYRFINLKPETWTRNIANISFFFFVAFQRVTDSQTHQKKYTHNTCLRLHRKQVE